jgi:hypothetical protein
LLTSRPKRPPPRQSKFSRADTKSQVNPPPETTTFDQPTQEAQRDQAQGGRPSLDDLVSVHSHDIESAAAYLASGTIFTDENNNIYRVS